MSSYCVRCKAKTPDVNPRPKTSSNGRAMVQSTCGQCKATKTSFVKSGNGILGSMVGSMLPF